MDSNYRLRLENFLGAKAIALKMLKEKIISEEDYKKAIKKLSEKYCIKVDAVIAF